MTLKELLESNDYSNTFIQTVQELHEDDRKKSYPYRYLSQRGLLNPEDFVLMYLTVKNKNSNLPANVRRFVVDFTEAIIAKVLNK